MLLNFYFGHSNLQEEEEKEEEEQARMKESAAKQKDVALEEMTIPTAREAELVNAKSLDKQEQLCEISRALAVLASASVSTWLDNLIIVRY